jgi:hypothetical protein
MSTDQDAIPDAEDPAPADLEGKKPSKLSDETLYLQFRQWYLLDDAHSKEWRDNAQKEFDFVAGDQWPEKTAKTLNDEGRLPLTFNYTGPFIEAVKGLEVGSRHEAAYMPREIEPKDIVANEVVGETARWMGDQCNAEDEQSEAFGDTVICGMGWTEAVMSYEEGDPDGQYMEQKLDVQEMRWDRSARKKNLQDARRVWRVREMTLDEARDMFPEENDADLNAPWAVGYDIGGQLKSDEERRLKLENSNALDPSNIVHIIQIQWLERECYYRVALGDGLQEMSEEEYAQQQSAMKDAGLNPKAIKAVKQYKKVRMQAFVGAKILTKGKCPDPERFTLQCITGKLHKSKGTWYGLLRLMKDPQINANKWLSQALHIMNSTAKGGVLAERGVFKNISEAQKTYANPQAITVVEDGAIQKGRIMQKPGTGLAAPYVSLTQLAVAAIPGVTGINLELLGMVDRNQPGILEQQRKQSGMTILSTLFDALRLYRKTNALTRLCYIQSYMPDQKIIRVNSVQGPKAIRFIRDEHLGKYDVVVSDAPTSPNQKEQTWVMLMQLSQSPTMGKLLEMPEVAVEVLNYCPLPSKIVELFHKALSQPQPQQQMQQELAMRDAQAKIGKTEAEVGKIKADETQSATRAILNLADAEVKRQQVAREAALTEFHKSLGRAGIPGMPPRMPSIIDHDPMAVEDSQASGLPFPPQLPTGPRPPAAQPGGMEDLADIFSGQGGGPQIQ